MKEKNKHFGRVDLVRDVDGVLRLMEMELTEPLLRLDYADSAARLADWLALYHGRSSTARLYAGAVR